MGRDIRGNTYAAYKGNGRLPAGLPRGADSGKKGGTGEKLHEDDPGARREDRPSGQAADSVPGGGQAGTHQKSRLFPSGVKCIHTEP